MRSYQWGYPNGWAPLHLIAVEGLKQCGYDQDATRIAGKYLTAIAGLFEQTGKLWEKYNVCDGTLQAASEYGNPEMLGWTAGVFVVFADWLDNVARAGVAVADRPEGPFAYLGSVRPCGADNNTYRRL